MRAEDRRLLERLRLASPANFRERLSAKLVSLALRRTARAPGYFANRRARIPERLELERVARRVVEKHRRLFADLAGEADARLDFETRTRLAQALRQRLPGLPLQHHPEMRHWHVVPVHRVVMHVRLATRVEMRDQLVTEEIEIHPVLAAAPFGTAEESAIETAGCAQGMDRYGEMEWLKHVTTGVSHHSSRARTARSG